MPRRLVLVLLAALALSAPAIAAETKPALFTLTSPAFKDNGLLPLNYAGGAECGGGSAGKSISPPLAWSNAPKATKSFAVVMIDPDGRSGIGSVHWVAYNIPATKTALKEGDGKGPGTGLTSGKNSRGGLGYEGPCGPPRDAPHHYVIDLLALDLPAGFFQPGLDRDSFLKMIAGHSLGPASLVVRYRRKP